MKESDAMGSGRPAGPEVAEGVRATIAEYTHALDDGRTDDVVATYCAEGTFDMPGLGTFSGHDALRRAYAGWVPRAPQRHLVVNTLVTDQGGDSAAATSDVVLTVRGEAGWAIQFVARYDDDLRLEAGRWRFLRRAVTVA